MTSIRRTGSLDIQRMTTPEQSQPSATTPQPASRKEGPPRPRTELKSPRELLGKQGQKLIDQQLFSAVQTGTTPATVVRLLNDGASPNTRTGNEGYTAFEMALPNPGLVEAMLAYKDPLKQGNAVQVDQPRKSNSVFRHKTHEGETPFNRAMRKGHVDSAAVIQQHKSGKAAEPRRNVAAERTRVRPQPSSVAPSETHGQPATQQTSGRRVHQSARVDEAALQAEIGQWQRRHAALSGVIDAMLRNAGKAPTPELHKWMQPYAPAGRSEGSVTDPKQLDHEKKQYAMLVTIALAHGIPVHPDHLAQAQAMADAGFDPRKI